MVQTVLTVGNNPMQAFAGKLATYTRITYVSDHEISFGARTRKPITQENDAELTKHIASLPDGLMFKDALVKFQTSEKYVKALADGKTAPLDLGDVHIIKVMHANMEWMDGKALADFYAKRANAVKEVRKAHGFGKLNEEYAADDWRFKYKGVGIEPAKSDKAPAYKNVGNSLYENADGAYALRQVVDCYTSPEWYYVSEIGVIEVVPNDVMEWLSTAYTTSKPKAEVVYEGDEKAYVDALNAIDGYELHESTFTLANTAFVVDDGLIIDNRSNLYETHPYMKNVFGIN